MSLELPAKPHSGLFVPSSVRLAGAKRSHAKSMHPTNYPCPHTSFSRKDTKHNHKHWMHHVTALSPLKIVYVRRGHSLRLPRAPVAHLGAVGGAAPASQGYLATSVDLALFCFLFLHNNLKNTTSMTETT